MEQQADDAIAEEMERLRRTQIGLARLRVRAQADIPVADVILLLRSVEQSYLAIGTVTATISLLETLSRALDQDDYVAMLPKLKAVRIPVEPLVLNYARLNSPGTWGFVGDLLALKPIAEIINGTADRITYSKEFKEEISARANESNANAEKTRAQARIEVAQAAQEMLHRDLDKMKELGFTDEEIREVYLRKWDDGYAELEEAIEKNGVTDARVTMVRLPSDFPLMKVNRRAVAERASDSTSAEPKQLPSGKE